MIRKDLQDLARIRLREARAPARLGMSDGAYHLAGYCIECALKACIAKATERHDFPDKKKANASYSHIFRDLLIVAGIEKAHSVEVQRDPAFRQNWDIVQLRTQDSRYASADAHMLRHLLKLWAIEIVESSDG